MKIERYIGIDTGTNTGIAVWDKKERIFESIQTLKIHQALKRVEDLNELFLIKVYVEDARLRKWFGSTGREKLQGVGSVKRDARIWEDFLKDKGISYEMIPPMQNSTKMEEDLFKIITKYEKRTSEHGRDAAMLVFQK